MICFARAEGRQDFLPPAPPAPRDVDHDDGHPLVLDDADLGHPNLLLGQSQSRRWFALRPDEAVKGARTSRTGAQGAAFLRQARSAWRRAESASSSS